MGKQPSIQECDKNTFDASTGIFDDECYAQDRDRQSAYGEQYWLQNFREQDCGAKITQLAACHPNLRFKNGYGNLDSCNVNEDSRMRYGSTYTNPKHRQQLTTRLYQGNPNLARGAPAPDIEGELIHSDMSRTKRPCGVLSGVTTDVFTPLIPCVESAQDSRHIVPDWNITDTRAWVRDEDLLKRCGYYHDGRGWVSAPRKTAP